MRGRFLGFGTVGVSGDSMAPTYSDGDWLLVHWRGNPEGALYAKPGNVVVIERDEQPGIFYVKRISDITRGADGKIRANVSSDNPAGTDSRNWGSLHCHEIKARCIGRVKKRKALPRD